MNRLLDWLRARRSVILRALVIVAVLAVCIDLVGATPRDTELALELGDAHAGAREVRAHFVDADGETQRSVIQRFPDGAPAAMRHSVELPPGHYRAHVDLVGPAGDRRTLAGAFEAPGEGVVHVALREER